MQYNIFGGNLPAVTITFNAGESIFTQSGGLSWMTQNIEMQTNMRGGFMKGLGRMFAGESLFMATYTALCDGEEITLGASLPGTIRVFEISPGKEYIAQKQAFLCATSGVELSACLTKRLGSGLFGGEGFILQKFAGQGLVFAELDGTVVEYELKAGQIMKVDTGNVAAFESTVSYSVEMVKGFKNILFGGEGLFLTTLQGPGKIWLQTMTASDLASRVIPFMPSPSN